MKNKKDLIITFLSLALIATIAYASEIINFDPNGQTDLPSLAIGTLQDNDGNGQRSYTDILVNDASVENNYNSTARTIVTDPLLPEMNINSIDLNAKFVALQFQYDKLQCETLETGYYVDTVGCETATSCDQYRNSIICNQDLSGIGGCSWDGTNCVGGQVAILGCTDPNASNYDSNANQDDGSCGDCNSGYEKNGGVCELIPPVVAVAYSSVTARDESTSSEITSIEEGDNFFVNAVISQGEAEQCYVTDRNSNIVSNNGNPDNVSSSIYNSGLIDAQTSEEPYELTCLYDGLSQSTSQAITLDVTASTPPPASGYSLTLTSSFGEALDWNSFKTSMINSYTAGQTSGNPDSTNSVAIDPVKTVNNTETIGFFRFLTISSNNSCTIFVKLIVSEGSWGRTYDIKSNGNAITTISECRSAANELGLNYEYDSGTNYYFY